jgi:hypothetical protein
VLRSISSFLSLFDSHPIGAASSVCPILAISVSKRRAEHLRSHWFILLFSYCYHGHPCASGWFGLTPKVLFLSFVAMASCPTLRHQFSFFFYWTNRAVEGERYSARRPIGGIASKRRQIGRIVPGEFCEWVKGTRHPGSILLFEVF